MSKKKKQLLILGSIVLAIILIGGIYAWFQLTLNGTKDNIIKAGTLTLELDDKATSGITITDGVPMLEKAGLTKDGYTFTLTNTGTVNSEYSIYLDDMSLLDGETKLEDKYIRYNLQRDIGNLSKTKLLSGLKTSPDRVLETGVIKPGEKYTYTLRLWIDASADNTVNGKVFRGRIRLDDSQKNGSLTGTLVKAEYSEENNRAVGYFWDYSDNITKVILGSEISGVNNPVQTWDLSVEKNETIMGYLTGNETLGYTLYIQSDGPIYANADSSYLFYYFLRLAVIEGLENLDTSRVTNMPYMFTFCQNLKTLNLSSFNTSNVTNMENMFSDCQTLETLNLSNFNTSKVTNMGDMFGVCISLTDLDLTAFDTSKVTNMIRMFYRCEKLTNLNVSTFDTSNVTNMEGMFQDLIGLTNLDLSNFDTSNVTNMEGMFELSSGFTNLDLSSFDTSKVENMLVMFRGCIKLETLNIKNFSFKNLTSYNFMFESIPNTTIITVKDIDAQNRVIRMIGTNFSTTNVIIG